MFSGALLSASVWPTGAAPFLQSKVVIVSSSHLAKLKSRLVPVSATRSLAPEHRALIDQIRSERLTYLSRNRLAVIAETCLELDRFEVPGRFIEAGCALGGSAIMIARLKAADRPLAVHDVFGMIPPPGELDGDDVIERYETIRSGQSDGLKGDPYYGYEDDLLSKVSASFERFGVDRESQNVELVEGLVQDTLTVDAPVAFAHIDVDWYEPVLHCLEQIVPHLSVGGSIVLDDYFDWSGSRKATDEYFGDDHSGFARDSDAGSLRITRLAST